MLVVEPSIILTIYHNWRRVNFKIQDSSSLLSTSVSSNLYVKVRSAGKPIVKNVASNIKSERNCSNKRRDVRVCTVWYDAYSVSFDFQSFVYSIHTSFYIRAYTDELDETDQDE
jgi:hypothetical protein